MGRELNICLMSALRILFITTVGRVFRLCRHGKLIQLVFLMFMGLFTFSLHQYNHHRTTATPLNIKLGTALHLIQGDKMTHFDELESFQLLSDDEKWKALQLLRTEIQTLILKCSTQNNDDCSNTSRKGVAILTLFTTWVYAEDKFPVNNRTLINWRMLPDVNLIVFSNCSTVKKYSEAAGWTVLPVMRGVADVPVLPYMFIEAKLRFTSHFYGFANADLFFTADGLIRTLQKVRCQLEKLKKTNVLLVGQRTNIPAAQLTDEITGSVSKLEAFALKYGSRFITAAEDYFITDSIFPWSGVLPVIIGRRAYDNYIVAYAREINTTVIDVSDSVQCLHQTVESRGNYEGLHKGITNSYNYDLIKKHRGPGSSFFGPRGRTDCAAWRTWQDMCGHIQFGQRTVFERGCDSASLYEQFQSHFGLSWGA